MVIDKYVIGRFRQQPGRTAVSVAGTALCAILMLFLLGVYGGVSRGSLEFIERSDADLWVLQRNATNLLRCNSVLWYKDRDRLRAVAGVASAAPLFLFLATAGRDDDAATVYLSGYEPHSRAGGPPRLFAGRGVESDDELVLDRSFARKYDYQLGDTVYFHNCGLRLVGISEGTNAFVVQYAFVTLTRAWRIAGYEGVVTCFIVQCEPEYAPPDVALSIGSLVSQAGVLDHSTFLRNNTRELQAGFLPFVVTLSCLGAVVLGTLLSLLLLIAVVECRNDLAVMKTLGAPVRHVACLILQQSLALVLSGLAVALACFPVLRELLAAASPEMTVCVTPAHLIFIAAGAVVIAVLSTVPSIRKSRTYYADEALV